MLRDKIPVSTLKDILKYDPQTGVLTWKKRPLEAFKRESRGRSWNTIYAGKEAGSLCSGKNTKYIGVGVFGLIIRAHRICWAMHYGEWPHNQIDHIDGDGTNNRISNLRDVTQDINLRNSVLRKHNTSGTTGVCWGEKEGKWKAAINVNCKRQNLGCFENMWDAICARKSAEGRIGGFAQRTRVTNHEN